MTRLQPQQQPKNRRLSPFFNQFWYKIVASSLPANSKPCLQCCGSGMFIPDPRFKNSNKKFVVFPFSCSHKYRKIKNNVIFWRKKFGPIYFYFCIFELIKKKIWANLWRTNPQKLTLSSQNIGLGSRIRDLGAGKNLFRIPDKKGTGSWIRIRDTACLYFFASIVSTLSLPTIFVITIMLPKASQVKERSYKLNIGLLKGLKVERVGSVVISGYSWSTKTRRLFKNFVPELYGQNGNFLITY
jgi:hypothetical protein